MSWIDAYEIFLLLNVLVHLFFSYLLLAGFPMMVMTAWLCRNEGMTPLKTLAQRMAKVVTVIALFTLGFGLSVYFVIFQKYGYFLFDALPFPRGSRLVLILFALAMLGFYFYGKREFGNSPNFQTQVMLVGGIFVCFLGITLLHVISHIMILNPDYSESVSQQGLVAAMSLPTVWPRFLHIVLGSVAATGILIALYGTVRHSPVNQANTQESSSILPYDVRTIRYGVGWTLAGTLPQIVVGPWVLLSLPDDVRTRLVDGASLSSLVFFVSLTLALVALVLLNASLMVPHVRGLVWAGLGSLFLTIVLMVLVREEVRKGWMQSAAELNPKGLSPLVVLVVVITSLLGALMVGRIIKGRAKG